MKNFEKLIFLCLFLTCISIFPASAQVCDPDTTVGVGIHPQTPPPGCVGTPYDEVVTFVFPADTVYGGFTVPFDSFVVNTVLDVPLGLNWECDQSANNCTYYTNPPDLTRGCVRIDGTPQMANDSSDSVIVVGAAWITVFGFPVEIEDSIKIHIRICPDFNCFCVGVGREEDLAFAADVYPHPLTGESVVRFSLEGSEAVSLKVTDLLGRVIIDQSEQRLGPGEHSLPLNAVPAGYAILELRVGEKRFRKRILSGLSGQ